MRKPIAPGRQPVYRSKLFQEHVHDSYRASVKPRGPTACPECGAVFADGRWQWLATPEGAHAQLCPACHRIRDSFPQGYVTLSGPFVAAHRAELVALMRHVEHQERAEHPLQRIMDIADDEQGITVRTTDVHLAHGLGEALRHAYHGDLDSHYSREENLVRVRWTR